MTIIDNNKCPNHICDGKIKIKYLSKNLDYKKLILVAQQIVMKNHQSTSAQNVKLFSLNSFSKLIKIKLRRPIKML